MFPICCDSINVKYKKCDLCRQVADLSSKLREMRQYWIQLPVAICSKLAAGGANQDKCWNGITKARWGSRHWQAVQNSSLTQSKLFNSFAFLSVSFRCGQRKSKQHDRSWWLLRLNAAPWRWENLLAGYWMHGRNKYILTTSIVSRYASTSFHVNWLAHIFEPVSFLSMVNWNGI